MYIISGKFRRQKLNTPQGSQTRPTASRLREALFNICQNIMEGAHFLDLFAGSGSMGFEALSRGAETATFIDRHKEAIICIQDNAERLKVKDQCRIIHGDIFTALNRLAQIGKSYELIYADPPYSTIVPESNSLYSTQIISWIDQHAILKLGGYLFIEEDFLHQPHIHDLHNLTFIGTRRMGKTALQQYRRI